MKNNTSIVPETMVQTAKWSLEVHASPIAGLQLALLATHDGFEIASLRNRSDLQTTRLSAMASSLMAMARAVGRDIQSPICKRLTFEAEGSTVIFQSIDSSVPCILCLVLGHDAVLGLAFWAAGEVAQELFQSK